MITETISNFFRRNRGVEFRFTLEEFSGAFGDSITVIPLLVGIALTTGATLSPLLLFFGIFQITVGLYFRLPMPVEPMKALAALVIAGTLSYSEVTAAGIVLGIMLLASGGLGLMGWLNKFVPTSVVRGIQLGLALILLESAVGYVTDLLWLASIGIIIVLIFLFLNLKKNVPNISAFIVILVGIFYGVYIPGLPPVSLIELPELSFPPISSFPRAIAIGAFPQFLLSVGNAVLATSLLFQDLLGQKISPGGISKSMGVMCLTSSLFGGFPMCHGSGGLAGQYRFGARTGGSNLILGSVYLGVAVIAGSASFLGFFPYSILGALLVFISIELGSAAKATDQWSVTILTGIVSFLTRMFPARKSEGDRMTEGIDIIYFGLIVLFQKGLLVKGGFRMDEDVLEERDDGVLLKVKVRPGSDRFEVGEVDPWRGQLKVWVGSEARRGEANRELLEELGSVLDKDVRIVSGERSREKKLLVEGATKGEVVGKLELEGGDG